MKENINTKEHWDQRYSGMGVNLPCPEVWKHLLQSFYWSDLQDDGHNKILDVGCGVGLGLRLINLLYPHKKLYGVDISERAIDRLKRDLPNAILKCEQVPPLSFSDNFFDTVICTEVLEHLEKPQDLLKEIARVLKDNGDFLVTVPNDCLGDHPEHLHQWEERDFIAFLEEHGFFPVDVKIFPLNSSTEILFVKALRKRPPSAREVI